MKHLFKEIILSVALGGVLALPGRSQSILEEYVETGIRNNEGLQASYKMYLSSLEEIRLAGSLANPTLSIGYMLSPVETRVGPQQVRFSFMQMFPWFQTLGARREVEEARSEAMLKLYSFERNKLATNIREAWLRIYEVDVQLRITRMNIDLLDSWERVATRKYESAEAGMVDVIRVQLMTSDLTTRLEVLEARRKALVSTFRSLINDETLEIVLTPDDLSFPSGEDNLEEWESAELVNNPRFQALQASRDAASKNVRVATLSTRPQLGLGFDYALVAAGPNDALPDNGKDILMPMVSLSLPIYRQKNQSTRKISALKFEETELRSKYLLTTLQSEFERYWQELVVARENYSLLQIQKERTTQAIKILTANYMTSGVDFVELLRMEQSLLQYQLEAEKATVAAHIAVARINEILNQAYTDDETSNK